MVIKWHTLGLPDKTTSSAYVDTIEATVTNSIHSAVTPDIPLFYEVWQIGAHYVQLLMMCNIPRHSLQ